MHKTLKRVALSAALVSSLVVLVPMFALADNINIDFESPNYTAALNVNSQDGWSNTGLYDANVVANTYGIPSFGLQTLQISDSKTSGSFGDQVISKPLANEVGETDALNGGMSGGTRQAHFEATFDLASTQATQQPGMHMTVSPDRGDGARMSYLRFEDGINGIDVFFDDVQGVTAPANFVETKIATISRSAHTIKMTLDAINGPSNDVVKVYIDGNLMHVGTSWENYYRYDTESQGNPHDVALENKSRTVDSLLFRESGTATPADAGKGFLIDNLTLSSGAAPIAPTPTTVVVSGNTSAGENLPGWMFNRDASTATPFVFDTTAASIGAGSLHVLPIGSNASDKMVAENFINTPISNVNSISYDFKIAGSGVNTNEEQFYMNVYANFGQSDDLNFYDCRYDVIPTVGSTAGFTTVTFDPTQAYPVTTRGSSPFACPASPAGMNLLSAGSNIRAIAINVGDTSTSDVGIGGYLDKVVTNLNSAITTYDFDPAPAPTTEKVTIIKYLDNVHATATNANSAVFPFTANYQASNVLGGNAGSDPFDIGPVGNGTPNAYEAQTIPLATGASYSASENVTGNNVVGATCADGKPFALAGYSSGDTFAQAFANASSSAVAPAFTNLQSDKVVIVWNKTCPVVVTPTVKVHILKYLNNAEATAASANNYQFPMSATWMTANLNGGATSTGNYVLGNGHGGAASLYGADTSPMSAPANYLTNEVTGGSSNVVASKAECAPGKYVLEGYKVGSSFADAAMAATSTDVALYGITSDQYVLVYNTSCPTKATLTVYKNTVGGNGTFNFTGSLGAFSVQTVANTGNKVFTDLTPGTYSVAETAQAGWTMTENTCTNLTLVAGDNVSCTIVNTNNSKLGSIRGTKFEDWDGDSSPFETKWEVGLQGFTIYLDSNNNGVKDAGEQSTVTDSHGVYSFTNLPAGTYHVREVQQAGWTQTYPSVNAANNKYDVVLAAGQNAKKKDFGNFKLGTISGMKYNDLNGNGRKGANEPGLSGWTIKLKGNNGYTSSAVTDAQGNYSFSNLPAGNYQLSEVMQNGWKQTDKPGLIKIRSAVVSTKDDFGNTQKTNPNNGHHDND